MKNKTKKKELKGSFSGVKGELKEHMYACLGELGVKSTYGGCHSLK